MPILLLLIQILVSNTDFPAFALDFDAYHTDLVASGADIDAYDADVAASILHLLLQCNFSSSVFDSTTADAGTISQNWGWPCTALRAQYGQPPAKAVLKARIRNPIPKSDSDSESARNRA